MSADISPDDERIIQQGIASGSFRDRREALDARVELLKQPRRLIDRLNESRRQLNVGEDTEYDPQSLRGLFDDLKARASAASEARRDG